MMKLLAALALALAGCGNAAAPATPSSPPPMTDASGSVSLFEFADGDAAWRVVNDGVMGGRSQGFVAVEDGTLRFTGELVTQGGGFTSVRAARRADLSASAGVALRVRGGGRTFEIDLDDGSRLRGRQVSRRATFGTSEAWQTVFVPFSALRSSVFGRPVRVEAFDPASLDSVGLFIADGQDGPFRLEVDWIRAADGPEADD